MPDVHEFVVFSFKSELSQDEQIEVMRQRDTIVSPLAAPVFGRMDAQTVIISRYQKIEQ